MGCETYCAAWAGAFGVDFSANGSSDSVQSYEYVGRAPRAFVGWTEKIGEPGGYTELAYQGLLDAEYAEALQHLFIDWMDGYPLSACMNDYSLTATYLEPFYFQNAASWKISGCYDLERGD